MKSNLNRLTIAVSRLKYWIKSNFRNSPEELNKDDFDQLESLLNKKSK